MLSRRLLAPLCALLLLLVLPAGASALDRATVGRSFARWIARAGATYSGAVVRDLTTGEALYAARADRPRIPASVEKLFTTAAALGTLVPTGHLQTRVARTGTLDRGALDGDLLLIGGGDPTLGADDLQRLAREVRRAGIRRVSGSVIGDESRFDGLRGGPRTSGAADVDMSGVLGALTINRGYAARPGGPALAAARRFARALRARGVRVSGRTTTGEAPLDAEPIAAAASPSILELAQTTNITSDNFYAETLLKALAAQESAPARTALGASVARSALLGMGVSPGTIADGSGLSRRNTVTARQVVGLLARMHASDLGPAFESTLAVAGRTGTLRRRLIGTSAEGACRGKTGTLRDVSTLAGYCRTLEGHVVAFAILLNGVNVSAAHAAQDRAVAVLARYMSRPLGRKLFG